MRRVTTLSSTTSTVFAPMTAAPPVLLPDRFFWVSREMYEMPYFAASGNPHPVSNDRVRLSFFSDPGLQSVSIGGDESRGSQGLPAGDHALEHQRVGRALTLEMV